MLTTLLSLVGVGPGCTDETLLSAIASALHTSTMPITGQLSAAVEKNPGVWLNTAQPLCKAFMVTDEDIRYCPARAPPPLLSMTSAPPSVCETSCLPTVTLLCSRSPGFHADVAAARANLKSISRSFLASLEFRAGQRLGSLWRERNILFGNVLGRRKWLFTCVDRLRVWPAHPQAHEALQVPAGGLQRVACDGHGAGG